LSKRLIYFFRYFCEKAKVLNTKDLEEEEISRFFDECYSHVKQVEETGIALNACAYFKDCVLEGMFIHYMKMYKEVEYEQLEVLEENSKVITSHQEYILGLMNYAKEPSIQGNVVAKLFFERIFDVFVRVKSYSLKTNAIVEIKKEFPDTLRANRFAYENSFGKKDYQEVIKYVIDINKYIRECYKNRCLSILRSKFSKIATMMEDFVMLSKALF
jgi:hypothetical protein